MQTCVPKNFYVLYRISSSRIEWTIVMGERKRNPDIGEEGIRVEYRETKMHCRSMIERRKCIAILSMISSHV